MLERDKVDTDMARELWGSPECWNVRKSYIDVARKLGIDEEMVRNRIRRMKDTGYLLGWMLAPNPSLLGRTNISFLMEFDEAFSKEEAIPRLKQMEGVTNIASNYGNTLEVMVFDDEDGSSSHAIEKFDPRVKIQRVPGTRFPQTSFNMTITDWRIVRLTLRNAERKVTEVATRLKMSPRSIRRRLDMMMNSSAIFAVPMVNQKKSDGIAYRLIVATEEGERSEVDRQIAPKLEHLGFKAADSQNGLIYGFSGSNIAAGNEVAKWVGKLQGIRSTRMTIIEEVAYVFDWLESEIDKLI